MFKAIINVTLKESILDPQGAAVKSSLQSIGFSGVQDVRIGKRIEVLLEREDKESARAEVELMCVKVFANQVIEHFSIDIEEAAECIVQS